MKKHLAIILALCLAFSMTACVTGKTNVSENDTTSQAITVATEESTVTSTDETTANKPVPAETTYEITDWSIDDVAKNITLNGKKISLPCTIKDLGDGYSYAEKKETDLLYGKIPVCTTRLLYNGKECASVGFSYKENEPYENGVIYFLGGLFGKNKNLTIDEITIGKSKEEIEKKYGKENFKSEINYDHTSIYIFNDKNNRKEILVNYDENLMVENEFIIYEQN